MILRPGHEAEGIERQLTEFLTQFVERGVTSRWAIPDRVQVVDEIPKTSVGKINKKVIRSKPAQG